MNICFICTGNTCRSPLAEGILLSKHLDGVSVRSAGVYAMDGGPISRHSERLLMENGMTAAPTSRRFTQEDAEWADVILTMTATHRDTLQRTYPTASNNIYTLKEYVGELQQDVSDPYGGDFTVYRHTFNELSTLIDVLTRKLLEERK